MPGDTEEGIEVEMRLVTRTLRRSWLPPAAAGAVALEEAGHDRGTVGDRWLRRDARRR